jgi:hypothetical protein
METACTGKSLGEIQVVYSAKGMIMTCSSHIHARFVILTHFAQICTDHGYAAMMSSKYFALCLSDVNPYSPCGSALMLCQVLAIPGIMKSVSMLCLKRLLQCQQQE